MKQDTSEAQTFFREYKEVLKQRFRQMEIWLVAFNGQPLGSIDDLHRRLTDRAIGARSRLTILRRAAKLTLDIVPEESFPVSR